MKIETKYDIGQEVWIIEGNKCVKTQILKIYIEMLYEETSSSGFVSYELDDTWLKSYNEDQLFPTKEELLKSL